MAELNKIEIIALEFIKLQYGNDILVKISNNPQMYNFALSDAYKYAKIFIDTLSKKHESSTSPKHSGLRVLNENHD